MAAVTCIICKEVISEGKYIQKGDLICHSSCFKCSHCHESITSAFVEYAPSVYLHAKCLSIVEDENAIASGHICERCSKPCYNEQYVSLPSGQRYHQGCFTCTDCGKRMEGEYVPYGEEKLPLHAGCARKRNLAKAVEEGKVCRRCGKPCVEGKILTVADSEMYHSQCFLCTKCNKPIAAKFVQLEETKEPYHPECVPGTNTAPSSGRPASGSKKQVLSKDKGSSKTRLCKCCHKECSTGRFFNTTSGDIYHADCFRCSAPTCNGPITGPYAVHGDPPLPYHPECGKELFAPRCCLCTGIMEGQFFRHPFFDTEAYCLSHETRTSCFACGRKEPLPSSQKQGFVDLLDGRSLCAPCASSIVIDANDAVLLYRSIVTFMGSSLGLTIPTEMVDIPVLLVDVQTLNENRSKLGDALGHHAVDELSAEIGVREVQHEGEEATARFTRVRGEAVIRGVTLSKSTEVRHMPSAKLTFDGTRSSFKGGQLPQLCHVTQTRDVSAVLVLYGLPRDLTASILAHEAMHVWLKLNKSFPFRMPPKLEEGLCQVIAFMYLESLEASKEASPASSSQPSPHSVAATPVGPNKIKGNATTKLLSPRGSVTSGTSAKAPSSGSGSLSSSGSGRPNVRKASLKPKSLTRWFRQQIAHDKSPIYGEGFKEVYALVAAMGLSPVLAHIQRHQTLPPMPKTAARLPALK